MILEIELIAGEIDNVALVVADSDAKMLVLIPALPDFVALHWTEKLPENAGAKNPAKYVPFPRPVEKLSAYPQAIDAPIINVSCRKFQILPVMFTNLPASPNGFSTEIVAL